MFIFVVLLLICRFICFIDRWCNRNINKQFYNKESKKQNTHRKKTIPTTGWFDSISNLVSLAFRKSIINHHQKVENFLFVSSKTCAVCDSSSPIAPFFDTAKLCNNNKNCSFFSPPSVNFFKHVLFDETKKTCSFYSTTVGTNKIIVHARHIVW